MCVQLNITYDSPQLSFANLTENDFNTYFEKRGDGLLSESVSRVQGFFVSNISKEKGESNWPDIRLLWNRGNVPQGGKVYDSVAIIMARTEARGSLKLNTKAYLQGKRKNEDLALINYPLFENEEDLLRVREGERITLKNQI